MRKGSTMRKLFAGIVLGLIIAATPFVMAAALTEPTEGTEQATPYGRWKTTANLPSAGTEPLDLDVDERTYLTIAAAIIADSPSGDGKIILGKIPYGVDALRFRLSGITEGGSIIVQVYTGARDGYPDCEMVKRGTLTFTIGQQGSIEATFEMADTVVVSNTGATTKAWVVASPGDNTCCEVFIDMQGDDTYAIVGTTVACNAKLFMKDF